MATPPAKDTTTVNRIKTGIIGLDDALYGGIPEGTQNLIMGSIGTCKSLLAFNILYNNAKRGVPCTYVTIDQTKEDLLKNIKSAFPDIADVDSLISNKKLNIAEHRVNDKFYTRESAMLFIAGIIKSAQTNNSRIVVLDSVNLIRSLLDDDRGFTRMMNSISENLHIVGVTSITIIEIPEKDPDDKIPGLYEQSMFDGIIRLTNAVSNGITTHFGKVTKLRFSSYKSATNRIQITPTGLTLTEVKA